jgi:hypothetical protein
LSSTSCGAPVPVFQLIRSSIAQAPKTSEQTEPLRICALRAQAQKINDDEVRTLDGMPTVFAAVDEGEMRDELSRTCQAPELLILKPNARVMLLKVGGGGGGVGGG